MYFYKQFQLNGNTMLNLFRYSINNDFQDDNSSVHPCLHIFQYKPYRFTNGELYEMQIKITKINIM